MARPLAGSARIPCQKWGKGKCTHQTCRFSHAADVLQEDTSVHPPAQLARIMVALNDKVHTLSASVVEEERRESLAIRLVGDHNEALMNMVRTRCLGLRTGVC
jgi:hypothetical protein